MSRRCGLAHIIHDASTATADTPLRQAGMLLPGMPAGVLASQSVNILLASMPPSFVAVLARLARPLGGFVANRHKKCGQEVLLATGEYRFCGKKVASLPRMLTGVARETPGSGRVSTRVPG